MSSSARETIQNIYRAAVAAVQPEVAVGKVLRPAGPEAVEIAGRRYAIPEQGVYAVGIGKASTGMLRAAAEVLGESLVDGIAVSKQRDQHSLERFEVHTGSHPVPDARSLAAGEAVLGFAGRVPAGALVLCLISGGGSALVEALREGVSLGDLQEATRRLLAGGATIHEINALRSRLSRIKGGGLLAALSHTTVVNLVISDVLGDDPRVIASGPSVPPARDADAGRVAATYGVTVRLPEALDRPLAAPQTEIIANLRIALEAGSDAARRTGFEPVILGESIDGEARYVGRLFAALAADSALGRTTFGPGTCLLVGGETTVTLRGEGRGGRNTEAALAAALRLEGVDGLTMGFLATDGDDSDTGAAGAIVDGATISADNRASARAALDENDSYTFLAGLGATWSPGSTGTNVNDLVIVLIGSR